MKFPKKYIIFVFETNLCTIIVVLIKQNNLSSLSYLIDESLHNVIISSCQINNWGRENSNGDVLASWFELRSKLVFDSCVGIVPRIQVKTRIKATWRKTVSSLAQIRKQMYLDTHFRYEFLFLGHLGHSGLQIKKNTRFYM